MRTLYIYIQSMRLLGRAQAQYRGMMVMQWISICVMTGTEFLGLMVLFFRYGSMGHWSADQVMFFFGLMTLTFKAVEMFTRGLDTMPYQVQRGEFDRYLLRPRTVFSQILSSDVDVRRLSGIAVGIATVAICSAHIGLRWTPMRLWILLCAVVGGAMLFTGLFMIGGIVSLRTIQSIEIANILTYGGNASGQIPSDIYPRAMRWFFYVVPYALTLHWPASYLVGQPIDGVTLPWVWIAPIASGAGFLAVMLVIWSRAIRTYQSTGS